MCYSAEMARKADIIARREGMDYDTALALITDDFHRRWTGIFGRPKALILTDNAEVQVARWTFLPHYVKSEAEADTMSTKTGNCRTETMFTSKAFGKSAVERRGLLAVNAYYEPQHRGSKVQWYRFFRPTHETFFLGVVWRVWNDTPTFAVCTMAPSSLASWIHNNPARGESRQPVVLRGYDEAQAWTRGGGPETVADILRVREDGFIVAQACRNENLRLAPKMPDDPEGRPEGVIDGLYPDEVPAEILELEASKAKPRPKKQEELF